MREVWKSPAFYALLTCSVAQFLTALAVAVPIDAKQRSNLREASRVQPSVHAESQAADFDSSGVGLLSQVPVNRFSSGSSAANDVWGYVSPSGREYAIIGLTDGTGFVEVTDPTNPIVIADIPDARSTWSDIAVYGEYAYNMNENSGGMQVIDLRQIDSGIVTLVRAVTDVLSTAHNIYANPDSGYVYPCGAPPAWGFLAYDLTDPANPQYAGFWGEAYAHDVYMVSYDDCPYPARAGQPCEIGFAFCDNWLKVVDVTDKSNMHTIATRTYPNISYCHQGWLSEDRRYLFVDDEADETSHNLTSTTYVFDVQNVSNPQYVTSFTNGQTTIDHNLMVRDEFLFAANYESGLRIYDVSNPGSAQEVGYFDTYPNSNNRNFNGAWGVYSGLPSGIVLISDQQGGLFVLNPCEALGIEGTPCVDDSNCLPGTCDTQSGSCVCVACEPPARPLAEEPLTARNRYLAFTPAEPGVQTALRVTLANMPPPFEGLNGKQKWVDTPHLVTELSSETGTEPEPNFMAAGLTCDPVFMDWGSIGPIYVFDSTILPNASYNVQAIAETCYSAGALSFSSALGVDTGLYGDLVGECVAGSCTPPDGDHDFDDIAAVVERFLNGPNAPKKSQADLFPPEIDFKVDFGDIPEVVNAFLGLPYRSPTPDICPAE